MTNLTLPHGLQLRSLVTPQGTLELSLQSLPTPAPGPDEVVVRMEATPINPSDIGLLLGAADVASGVASGTPEQPVTTLQIAPRLMKGMAARVGQSMPVGNEGAGVVIAAGSSAAAQAWLGKTVAVLGGAMYTQYRCIPVANCLLLPEGTTPADGASCFVNPLTALGMVDTMRREGHRALVHTAAASNLGQMLHKLCLQDGIELVNIVRKPEQAALLKGLGARYVCDSSAPDFLAELTEALAATGATLAFDATGGGTLAGQILGCMEAAISRHSTEYSRYGSTTHKQVYIYGVLDPRPLEIGRNFGFAWGMGGWLLFTFLQRMGPEGVQALRQRVAADIKTTFASHYAHEISLDQALQPEVIARYGQRSTGNKYLINPHKAAAH